MDEDDTIEFTLNEDDDWIELAEVGKITVAVKDGSVIVRLEA